MTNTYKIHQSDGKELNHPTQSDLVSNLTIFNEEYDSKRLSEIENFDQNEKFDKESPVTNWEKNNTLDC